jgi:multidrug resistance efflux pump
VVLLIVAVVLLAAWVCWLLYARIPVYAESDDGRFESLASARPVSVELTGRVATSSLVVGALVGRGDTLIVIDADVDSLTIEEHRKQIKEFLLRERGLDRQIEAEQRSLLQTTNGALSSRQEAVARSEQASIEAHLAQTEADRLTSLAKRAPVSEEELGRARARAGAASAGALAARLAAERVLTNAAVDSADRVARIREHETARIQLQGERRVEEARISTLGMASAQHVVRAPVAGRVGEFANFPVGSLVHAGDRLATIIPADSSLQIVAEFPSQLIGRIRAGQPARLRLDGYPWTRFGSVAARVDRVATEPVLGKVRVELRVAPGNAPSLPLQHGLTTNVEIQLERVSPWTLLLYAAGGRLATRDSASTRPTQ